MKRLAELYPSNWQTRYGAEFESLLEARAPGARDRIDIVRGAIDARLHPQVPGDPRPEQVPWTHRLPGLLAVAGGALWLTSLLSAIGATPDGGSFFVIAVVLMFLSLPGEYMANHARPIRNAALLVAASVVLVFVLPWGPKNVPAIVIVGVFGVGMLSLAGARADLTPRARWIIVSGAVLAPLTVAFVILIRGASGAAAEMLLPVLLVSPYGLAWCVVGLRMMVRGSATTEAPIETVAADEQLA